MYYKLNQQKIAFDKDIENNLELTKYFMEDKLLSDAKNNQFKGRYPDFDNKIKEYVKDFDKFYFYPNVGNMGDGIIAEAEYQILNNGKYNYSIVDNYSGQSFAPCEDYNLVYGGGGLFVKYWNYQKVLDIFRDKNLKNVLYCHQVFLNVMMFLNALMKDLRYFAGKNSAINTVSLKITEQNLFRQMIWHFL